jgi:UDP-N-acetylmuramyl tripeptide synthase
MDLRLTAAVAIGKSAGTATRLFRRGGGTALPGLVASRIDPALVAKLGGQLNGGRALVTGTNGKTTTSRILASILTEAELPFLHNRQGSNLMRGFASTLVAASNAAAHLNLPGHCLGIFETDEATMPAAARALRPRSMAFTNLFRDQLDRYGEVDTVAALWREALVASPSTATLVLNADDPSVAELARGWSGPVHWFGVDDPAFAVEERGALDARWCGDCGGTFAYDRRYFAHIGLWRCTGCHRARTKPETTARNIRLRLDSCSFQVDGLGELTMPLTGLYNIYNALAGIALARVLGTPDDAIRRGVTNVHAAFGRQEVIEHQGRRLRLMLIKNPTGANEVLRLLAAFTGERGFNVAVLLSDRFADGQDVSWIWDVDFEPLASAATAWWAGGTRAEDIALRLKYAGWTPPRSLSHDPAELLSNVVAATPPGSDVFVIATYTAMSDLRAALGRGVGEGREQ